MRKSLRRFAIAPLALLFAVANAVPAAHAAAGEARPDTCTSFATATTTVSDTPIQQNSNNWGGGDDCLAGLNGTENQITSGNTEAFTDKVWSYPFDGIGCSAGYCTNSYPSGGITYANWNGGQDLSTTWTAKSAYDGSPDFNVMIDQFWCDDSTPSNCDSTPVHNAEMEIYLNATPSYSYLGEPCATHNAGTVTVDGQAYWYLTGTTSGGSPYFWFARQNQTYSVTNINLADFDHEAWKVINDYDAANWHLIQVAFGNELFLDGNGLGTTTLHLWYS